MMRLPRTTTLSSAIVLVLLSGCVDLPESTNVNLTPANSKEGTLVQEWQSDEPSLVHVQFEMPPTGQWANVSIQIGFGVGMTDGYEVVALVGGMTSPLRPAGFLGYIGPIIWPDTPGSRYVSVGAGGEGIELPVGIPEPVREELDGTERMRTPTFSVELSDADDPRSRRDLGANDPLYYEVVAVLVPTGTKALPASLEVTWDGGRLRSMVAEGCCVITKRPSDFDGIANVAAGPLHVSMAAETELELGPAESHTVVWYIPPVTSADALVPPLATNAYVQRPGEPQEMLEPGTVAGLFWSDQPGLWRFGHDMAVQTDRWDVASVVAVDLPGLDHVDWRSPAD